jgi:DNA-binding FadR family transcriptional regulator
VFKTPTELVSGSKLPMRSLSWKSKESRALIREAMQQVDAEQANEEGV